MVEQELWNSNSQKVIMEQCWWNSNDGTVMVEK